MGCAQSKKCGRWCCCGPYPSSSSSSSHDVNPAAAAAALGGHHFLTGNSVGSVAVPGANLSLHFSSLTQRGHYPDSPDRLNQDSFLIKTNLQRNPNLHLFAVFDGHGQFGGECADFAMRTLAQTLESDPSLPLDPSRSFSSAFKSTNALLRSSGIDDSMSGTTAIAVLVRSDALVVANVGDSRAVAGVWDAAKNRVVAEDLSIDQTPFRKDEYERVRRCGARVLSVDQVEGIKDPEVQSWGDEESDEGDPPRLWVQDGMYPGTAFTRSVGDSTAEGIGVVAVPEVKEVRITPDVLFFVVASDGVFEFLSSQAVVNMVANYKDPRDACAAIAAESYKLWLEHENRTDDITIIIVHIKDMQNSNFLTTHGANHISSKASIMVSEKAQADKNALQGSTNRHLRRDSVSELQASPELSMEHSLSCVAPSPDHTTPCKT